MHAPSPVDTDFFELSLRVGQAQGICPAQVAHVEQCNVVHGIRLSFLKPLRTSVQSPTVRSDIDLQTPHKQASRATEQALPRSIATK